MNAANDSQKTLHFFLRNKLIGAELHRIFAVNTQIRSGTAFTGAEKPKTKLVIGFSSEQPAAPPACIAGYFQ